MLTWQRTCRLAHRLGLTVEALPVTDEPPAAHVAAAIAPDWLRMGHSQMPAALGLVSAREYFIIFCTGVVFLLTKGALMGDPF